MAFRLPKAIVPIGRMKRVARMEKLHERDIVDAIARVGFVSIPLGRFLIGPHTRRQMFRTHPKGASWRRVRFASVKHQCLPSNGQVEPEVRFGNTDGKLGDDILVNDAGVSLEWKLEVRKARSFALQGVEADRFPFDPHHGEVFARRGELDPVFELLGLPGAETEVTLRYEEAYARYIARDFSGALWRLAGAAGDGPTAVLADRCQQLLGCPPPEDWDGVYVATSK